MVKYALGVSTELSLFDAKIYYYSSVQNCSLITFDKPQIFWFTLQERMNFQNQLKIAMSSIFSGNLERTESPSKIARKSEIKFTRFSPIWNTKKFKKICQELRKKYLALWKFQLFLG